MSQLFAQSCSVCNNDAISYNVVLRNVLEGLGDVFLVDEGLRECLGANFGLRFSGVRNTHAWWWFGWSGLSL